LGLVVARVKPNGESIEYAAVISSEVSEDASTVMLSDVERVQASVRGLDETWEEYPPAFIAAEMPSAGARGARANRTMGIAHGTIVAWAATNSIELLCYLPSQCKKAVLGSKMPRKGVTKEQVEAGVVKIYGKKAFAPYEAVYGAKMEHIYDAASAVVAARDSGEYFSCVPA
jgi:Holliday junction resolvasome RuvABC endonuclease subunit